jgi:hypothetical protein
MAAADNDNIECVLVRIHRGLLTPDRRSGKMFHVKQGVGREPG